MSVTNTTNRVQENGNGSKTAFDFSFKIFASSEVLVYDVVIATGVATLKTLSTHYTVSINAVTDGGTVTWLTAPASGHASLIIRSIPYTQTADLPTEGNFREDQVENQLDRAAMRDIQLEELISQCVKVPLTSDLTDLVLPTPDAGKALVWNSAEDGFDNSQFNPDDAEQAATDAAASEAAAAASQVAAAASEAAAAASAAAAAAATASLTNFWGGTVGGTADAITLTPSPVLSSYTTGIKITFKATGTNTGAATVNVSGLGVKSLKTLSGAALTAGNITSGRVYTITYDGTDFVVHEMGTVEDGAIGTAKIASLAVTTAKIATGFGLVPSGGIIMWSGTIATIPSGWVLCNGSNSTPDLRNQFIVCADADSGGVAKSTVTGSALQSHATGLVLDHTHSYTAVQAPGAADSGGALDTNYTSTTGAVNSGNSSTKNIPVFYALAFIMKT